jgi:hypothetical protein
MIIFREDLTNGYNMGFWELVKGLHEARNPDPDAWVRRGPARGVREWHNHVLKEKAEASESTPSR